MCTPPPVQSPYGQLPPKPFPWPIYLLVAVMGTCGLCGIGCLVTMNKFGTAALNSGPGKAASQPTIDVKAVDLAAAYKDNEVAADGQYKDRNLVISGRVATIGKDILDSPYVTFATDPSNPYMENVQCLFGSGDQAALASLYKGEWVRIEGRCAGKSLINVLIRDCRLK